MNERDRGNGVDQASSPEDERRTEQRERMNRSTKILIWVVTVLVVVPVLYVFVDWRGARKSLEQARAEARAKGYPLTNAELDLPDPVANGADKVLAVHAAMEVDLGEQVLWELEPRHAGTPSIQLYRIRPEVVRASIARAEPHLARLRSALESSTIVYDTGPLGVDSIHENLIPINQLGRVLMVRSIIRLEEGQISGAVDDLDTLLRLSSTLDRVPGSGSAIYAQQLNENATLVAHQLAEHSGATAGQLRRASRLFARRSASYKKLDHFKGDLVVGNTCDLDSVVCHLLGFGSAVLRTKMYDYY